MIFGGDIAKNLLSPGCERMGRRLEGRERSGALRELYRSVLPGPVVHILKQVSMDGAIVGRVESALQRSRAQLLRALTRDFVFEGAQCRGMGQARFVFEDGRVRPKIGV